MAKPLTRAIRYLFNRIGYDFERLQEIHFLDGSNTRYWGSGNFDAFGAVVPREVATFDIFLRSCERVDVFNQSVTRFNGAPKSEVILRCINSLIRSIDDAIDGGLETRLSLTIIDDHSDADFVERLKALLETCRCPHAFVPLEDSGVGASLKKAYELARAQAKGLIYFAADDYLHELTAVREIVQSYGRLCAVLDSDISIFPSDYPESYRRVEPCEIMLGSERHWRSVPSTTGADVVSIDTLTEHWDHYMAFTRYGIDPDISEANTINNVYKNMPCFSPLPSLSVHFQHLDTLSPYFDWREWWEASAVDV